MFVGDAVGCILPLPLLDFLVAFLMVLLVLLLFDLDTFGLVGFNAFVLGLFRIGAFTFPLEVFFFFCFGTRVECDSVSMPVIFIFVFVSVSISMSVSVSVELFSIGSSVEGEVAWITSFKY